MPTTDLSRLGRAELVRLETEIQKLESDLRRAEERYAEDQPQYEAQRCTYSEVRDEEVRAIQAIGRMRDSIEQDRQGVAFLRG